MSKGNKGFFAIDPTKWAKACDLGMKPACAYLVLARFTGPDNVTTSASTNAVENYSNLSRSRSKESIDVLCKQGLIEKVKDGTHPRYKIQLGSTTKEPPASTPAQLRRKAQREKLKESEPQEVQRNGIWLPNSIVDGVVGAPSPLQQLRQTQDVMTLRLFVELYSGQNLIEDLGVSRQILFQQYKRTLVAEFAEWNIWGFDLDGTRGGYHPVAKSHYTQGKWNITKGDFEVDPKAFFARVKQLEDLGLLQWVPVVFESDSFDAEPMFELGDPTSVVPSAADEAADALLAKRFGSETAVAKEVEPFDFYLPVLRHVSKVQVIGVGRLRYRPHTSMTSTWWRNHKEKEERVISIFKQVIDKHMPPQLKAKLADVRAQFG